MGNYVFEEKNLNIDDSSLKAFATSVFNHIYPDVVDVNSERQKYEMMVHVHTMLWCVIPETGIDYERLLLRFKDELGDLMYHMWDQDCQMATPNFLREGSQEFFNSIVYDYIHVHYRELMEQARRSIPEPTEGTFSYGDYTFVPYREYTSDEKQKDLRQLTDKFQLRSDPDLGMSKYPGNKAEYDWNSFIDTANKSGRAACALFQSDGSGYGIECILHAYLQLKAFFRFLFLILLVSVSYFHYNLQYHNQSGNTAEIQ